MGLEEFLLTLLAAVAGIVRIIQAGKRTAAGLWLATCLLVGCTTVHTRFCMRPSEITSVFPATRLVAKTTFETFEASPLTNTHVSDQGSAMLIGILFLAYPVVEFPPALATDVLLLPMDAYYVSRKSTDKTSAGNRSLDNAQKPR